MKLAYSNLSWDVTQDSEVLKILKKNSIQGIELACSKIWQNPLRASVKDIKNYRNFWNKQNIEVVATTSLLYGHPELTLFESKEKRKETLSYLKHMSSITQQLGANIMMFGSPKNRIKGEISDIEAEQIAIDFFFQIAEHCKNLDIFFVIEPNPKIYGCDFILSVDEAVQMAKKVNHTHFGINLDSGAIAVDREANYNETVRNAITYVQHVHISEPYLKPIPDGFTNHHAFNKALVNNEYNGWASVEVVLPFENNSLQSIEKSLLYIKSTYQ